MKNIALVTAIGVFAFAQPAQAQDEKASEEPASDNQAELQQSQNTEGDEPGPNAAAALAEMMGTIFSAEPLTAQQEARLPAAGEAANALVPEGVYGRMMREMMDGTFGGLFDMVVAEGDAMSSLDLADYTGLDSEQVDSLSEEQRRELTKIFDPVYQERTKAEMAAMTDMMERVFGRLEPGLREGLSRALATRFTGEELAAINTFFATPTGQKYAGESLTMFTDPQIMASVGQAMPALMEEMPAFFGGKSEAADGLPEPRRYDDLTPAEQRRASELLGVDQQSLRERMADAEKAKSYEVIVDVEEIGDADRDDSLADAMEEVGSE